MINYFQNLDILGICNDTLDSIKEDPIFQEELNTFTILLQRNKSEATINGLDIGDLNDILSIWSTGCSIST